MLINGPQALLGAFSFGLIAARPLAEDESFNLVPRESRPADNLAHRQAEFTVWDTIVETTTDYVYITITTGKAEQTTSIVNQPLQSHSPVQSRDFSLSALPMPIRSTAIHSAFSVYQSIIHSTQIVATQTTSNAVAVPPTTSQAVAAPPPTSQAAAAPQTTSQAVAAPPPTSQVAPVPQTTSQVAAAPLTSQAAVASPAMSQAAVASQTTSQAAASLRPFPGSTPGGYGSNITCTTGDPIDPIAPLGFFITNSGSRDATYYIYGSINATSTSEAIPFSCAEVATGQRIFMRIPPGLNGRMMRGLPYSATTDHPSLNPASWFEFNHDWKTNLLWGDISLIQGYDGPILLEGTDGTMGFSATLPMSAASASYKAALTTKTGYPSNIPPPVVIGPTVQNGTITADKVAYHFYTDDPGPCANIDNGITIQNRTYVSNLYKYNPNQQTGDDTKLRIFNVTFFEGLIYASDG